MNSEPVSPVMPEPPEAPRPEKRLRRRGNEWMWGILLILLAILLVLKNLGVDIPDNWWALLILLPAFSCFANAWRASRAAEGHFNRRARGNLLCGVGFLFITVMFLFNLEWTFIGPILVGLVGLALIVNTLIPD